MNALLGLATQPGRWCNHYPIDNWQRDDNILWRLYEGADAAILSNDWDTLDDVLHLVFEVLEGSVASSFLGSNAGLGFGHGMEVGIIEAALHFMPIVSDQCLPDFAFYFLQLINQITGDDQPTLRRLLNACTPEGKQDLFTTAQNNLVQGSADFLARQIYTLLRNKLYDPNYGPIITI